ncbi:MAG: hypothetical protein K0S53_107 [Bacteroidetes bacterium]|jgi:DNA-binding CsgD family transcriptional regulator|nr:hypothetical protein [Bacteroidota bacterium]MDF2450613.1 hypothetical protein [Bacteroidota bacterium]
MIILWNSAGKNFILFFLFSFSTVYGQENQYPLSDSTNDAAQNLFTQYLSTTNYAQSKIIKLIDLASKDASKGDFSSRMEKIQIALILEKYVEAPCRATFDLNFTMGDIYRDINLQYAIFYYDKAIDIGQRSKEPTDLFTVHNILAGLYLKTHDHKRALNCYENAMMEAIKSGTVAISSVNNNIGWFYSKIGEDDSAMVYFNKARSFYSENTADDDLYANILENIAKVEERKGNHREALKIYFINDDFYRRGNNIGDFVSNRLNIFRTRLAMNDPGIEKSIDSLTNVVEKNPGSIDLYDALNFYKFSFDYFINKNNSRRSEFFNKRYEQLKDTIIKRDLYKANTLTNALLKVQSHNFKNEYDVYKAELQAAQDSSYKNKIIAFLFLISAVLMLLALAFFTQKRRKEFELAEKMAAARLMEKELEAKAIIVDLENARLNTETQMQKKDIERKSIENEFERERLIAKAELENKDLERRAMQNELELKKKDLTHMILLNTQVYESNKEMIELLQGISSSEDIQRSLKNLLTDLRAKNQVGERLSALQNNIDHLNTEFYQKLKLKFPDLTKTEIELCGYIMINLSNKDIALLKNVEPGSVKMSKTRLRKKLGINPDTNLLNFIKTI